MHLPLEWQGVSSHVRCLMMTGIFHCSARKLSAVVASYPDMGYPHYSPIQESKVYRLLHIIRGAVISNIFSNDLPVETVYRCKEIGCPGLSLNVDVFMSISQTALGAFMQTMDFTTLLAGL